MRPAPGLAMLQLYRLADRDGPRVHETMSEQLRAGISYLRADRTAGLLVVVVAIMVAFAYLAVVAEVVLAQGILRAGPSGYAVLVASWTAGMVGPRSRAAKLPGRWLVATALISTIATGAGIALAAWRRRCGRRPSPTRSAAWPTGSRCWPPAATSISKCRR